MELVKSYKWLEEIVLHDWCMQPICIKQIHIKYIHICWAVVFLTLSGGKFQAPCIFQGLLNRWKGGAPCANDSRPVPLNWATSGPEEKQDSWLELNLVASHIEAMSTFLLQQRCIISQLAMCHLCLNYFFISYLQPIYPIKIRRKQDRNRWLAHLI